ncbi:MAG: glutamate-1-semialdehyde 2,1-aminomutase [Porticoccaceae bacterium]|jgi:glutamate-1-semialdehyde 2,1-aminomutase|nr:glutamate-1-semialdehyde 2,1-aminomutase [Porticoccaceae bacterium]
MSLSEQLFQQAQQFIPGGVNSPVRAFRAVGGTPVFFEKAKGAHLWDVEGKKYVDYVLSWGPMILGHAHPEVIAAVCEKAQDGLSFGAPTSIESEVAEEICKLVPSIEMVRMVSSGTEATMSAIRLARGYTGRNKLIKFEGCYHGHSDSLLVKAGSGALTFGTPSSPGVPEGTVEHTINLPYNDIEAVTQYFKDSGDEVACVIVEPVAGNMNLVAPIPGFLETLRELCTQHGAVLIFDEVMTGFRVSLGGAQGYFNIDPDLTCLGKVVGGGMPVGAFGGKREIMEMISPLGPVYQAGTLSGNPVAMVAGLTTLKLIQEPGFYEGISEKVNYLLSGLADIAAKHDIPLATNSRGSMFGFFFSEEETVTNYAQVMACHDERFKSFFAQMVAAGVYLAPASYECAFMSSAHTREDLDFTLEQADKIMGQLP